MLLYVSIVYKLPIVFEGQLRLYLLYGRVPSLRPLHSKTTYFRSQTAKITVIAVSLLRTTCYSDHLGRPEGGFISETVFKVSNQSNWLSGNLLEITIQHLLVLIETCFVLLYAIESFPLLWHYTLTSQRNRPSLEIIM